MSAVIPDISKFSFAQKMRDDSLAHAWALRLFQNDYTPDHACVLGSLVEATFGSYSPFTLSGGTVASSLDSGGRAVISWAQVTFTKIGATANQIYGYYVTDNSGALLFAERAAVAPIRMAVDGDTLLVTPNLTDKSEFFNT